MVWKKSKSHHAWKAQSTEIIQENNLSCYFSHTVCLDLSECQAQMSWMIDHWFMKDLAYMQPCNDTKCHVNNMAWCNRKIISQSNKQTKTRWNSIMKLFFLLFMILIHLTSVLILVDNNRKSMEVSDLWRKIQWKAALSQIIFLRLSTSHFHEHTCKCKSFWDLMTSLSEIHQGITLGTKILCPV